MTRLRKGWLLFLSIVVPCSSFSMNQEIKIARNFSFQHQSSEFYSRLQAREDSSDELKNKAQNLLAKARTLRKEVSEFQAGATKDGKKSGITARVSRPSEWGLPLLENEEHLDNVSEYRLYVDIGRDPGTWMDSRWGASGRRIEFSLDVRFFDKVEKSEEIRNRMVKDNFGGKSSQVMTLQSADAARLRQGFDRMKCYGGAYRIDTGKNGASTARFYVLTDGTPEEGSSYGDVNVPKGCLYFSLPVFGRISQLSKKEGPVTVRQIGWHTGWRREESRIVGTFRAVPMDDARRKDGF